MEAATADQAFTGGDFRSALGSFATGVTVITTGSQGGHGYGMTANAFSSVSLDPPLVLVCVKSGAEGCDHIESNECFAVNVLASEQEPLSRYFSSKDRPKGRDAFRDVPHSIQVSGAPILDDVVSYLDCRLHSSYTAGDHEIYIGEVLALQVNDGVTPLLFFGGGYQYLR